MGEVDPVGSAGLVSPLELQIPMAGDALQDRERVLDGSLSPESNRSEDTKLEVCPSKRSPHFLYRIFLDVCPLISDER